MQAINGFQPVINSGANILILGSMPGKRSLQENQYYAHPRNSFWRIFSTLFDIEENLNDGIDYYQKRLESLKKANIALWDVLQSCERESSLDSDIVESSVVKNDFSRFFLHHKSIQHVYFNGAKAEDLYKRYVIPALDDQERELPMTRLPSTSPAYAAMSFEEKLKRWQIIRH
ncbi:MAG: DNA-deoxyinosine glycosylase [Pseudomonadales bacterium]|nr:DNA-deoxyinosine glycosylase [Pseudomonadales bacterium]